MRYCLPHASQNALVGSDGLSQTMQALYEVLGVSVTVHCTRLQRCSAPQEVKDLPCRYIFALYWAITTLATVGYGDFSAANPAEAVWATIYMFFNLALGAYVLGTITLIVIKHDERTGRYRDLITHLKDYIRVNEIPPVRPPKSPGMHRCAHDPTLLTALLKPGVLKLVLSLNHSDVSEIFTARPAFSALHEEA